MPKKRSLNNIYISERLQECLRPLGECALTTVVAPMGYGKTTAVNWYLSKQEKSKAKVVRISVYSDNLAIFWQSVCDAFSYAGWDFLKDYACPSDAASGSILVDILQHELAGDEKTYIFIDDFHLLTDVRVAAFIVILARRLPENVHLIVSGRDRFLSAEQAVSLGGKLYQISGEQLRLNHTELTVYSKRCGLTLNEEQIKGLLYSSEGWFSAVYLNMRNLAEHGCLADKNSDIYTLFTAAMIDPLAEEEREFLAVMGLADEFTIEMARFILENDNADGILQNLTEQNAFVKRLPGQEVYRFHHMMKECAERTFAAFESRRQAHFRLRYGLWYESKCRYLHALNAYYACGDYGAVLRVIQKDAGILLASLKPEDVLKILNACPLEILKAHPAAILVLMRSMFNWRLIPKMLELKEILLSAITENKDLSTEERGNLLGECDLIMSFLMYNDITEMSRLHQSASRQMSRAAVSIHKSGGWTFGSPSVLMMFHRAPGKLAAEMAEMQECMPHYYKITDGHGQGAEKSMSAEVDFMRGRFADAQIDLECAYSETASSGQKNMLLCCDFLAYRLALFCDFTPKKSFEERKSELYREHNTTWMNILNAAGAYYYALLGEEEKIPDIFREHRLDEINFLAPGKPMIEMIENQVYLAQKKYTAVIAQSESLLKACAAMNYNLVELHATIQSAAAYAMLGKAPKAQSLLKDALDLALSDNLLMPFAENYHYLKEIMPSVHEEKYALFLDEVAALGAEGEERRLRLNENVPAELALLSEREIKIVKLIQMRRNNREIAEELFLSEGSVKQYINQIYAKLMIDGDTRTKRRRLSQMMEG